VGSSLTVINRRDGIARRQPYELVASAVEERVGSDEERAGSHLNEGCESGIDLVFVTGLQDIELHLPCARRRLHVSTLRFVFGLFWFTSSAITLAWGPSRTAAPTRFGFILTLRTLRPVRLPPDRAKLATRPSSTGSPGKSDPTIDRAYQADFAHDSPQSAVRARWHKRPRTASAPSLPH
jgi:hypothetical protein